MQDVWRSRNWDNHGQPSRGRRRRIRKADDKSPAAAPADGSGTGLACVPSISNGRTDVMLTDVTRTCSPGSVKETPDVDCASAAPGTSQGDPITTPVAKSTQTQRIDSPPGK